MATEKERTTIMLHRTTKRALDSIKRPGQSYDGQIQELVKFWKDKKGEKSKEFNH